MVVSSPTYHIVSNIIPEYAGGRHRLGTIVDNLKDMTPLNEYEEIEVCYISQCRASSLRSTHDATHLRVHGKDLSTLISHARNCFG